MMIKMCDYERYEIKYGKYGAYFYDKEKEHDMTLEEVRNKLNLLHLMGDKD